MQILSTPARLGSAWSGRSAWSFRARLTCHWSEFEVSVCVCTEPNCTCDEAVVYLRWPVPDLIVGSTRIRLADGAESGGRSVVGIEAHAALDEVVAGLPPDLSAIARAEGAAARSNLRPLRPDPAWRRHDDLVPYAHFLAGGRPGRTYRAWFDEVRVGRGGWYVQDHLCPSCACRSFGLEFVSTENPQVWFFVRSDHGELVEVEDRSGCTSDEARRVYDGWRRLSPHADWRLVEQRLDAVRSTFDRLRGARASAAPLQLGSR